MRVLSREQILMLHAALVMETGGSAALRDSGLLDSAISAPFQCFGEIEPYPSIQQKAARLCFGLVKNHPFVDGNKRIGVHAMLVFLELNGIVLQYTQEELYTIILEIASGKKNYEDLLDWVICHDTGK